jgi:hypothetical protein
MRPRALVGLVASYDASTVAIRVNSCIPNLRIFAEIRFTTRAVIKYDTYCAPCTGVLERRRGRFWAEVWQFLMVTLGFFVAAVSWLFVDYLPHRALERWEGQRPARDRFG